jgi:uncharacterized membrane protein YhaH (DUF805 family)
MSNPALAPMDIFRDVLKHKYSTFTGRARRAEYWWFTLIVTGIAILGSIIALILSSISEPLGFTAFAVLVLAYLAILIPALALSVRRLHDTNKSGWFLLLSIVPFGSIILLVLHCLDSDQNTNKFGPSPKYGSPLQANSFGQNTGTFLQ